MTSPRKINFSPIRRGRLFKSEVSEIEPLSFEEKLTPESSQDSTTTSVGTKRSRTGSLSLFNKRTRVSQSSDDVKDAYTRQVNYLLNHYELKLITDAKAKKKFVSEVLIWLVRIYQNQKIVNTTVNTRRVNRPIRSLANLMLDAWQLASLMDNPVGKASLAFYKTNNYALYYRVMADKYDLPEEFKNENLHIKMIVSGEDNEGEVSDEIFTANLETLDHYFGEKILADLKIQIQEADKNWWKLLSNILHKQMTDIEKYFPEQAVGFISYLTDSLCTEFEEWIINNVNNPERTRAVVAPPGTRR